MWSGMTGAVLDYAGTVAPDGWLMCYGQSLLRSAYPNLFARIGTTFGAVDGTHFSLPDYRGRVAAGRDDMGGVAAGRVTPAGAGIDGATLGAAGGAETHTLTTAQMPNHTHANTLTDTGHTHTYQRYNGSNAGASPSTGNGYQAGFANIASGGATTGITINNAAQGSGNAHPNVQPTLMLNKIIKT
jgi:microcystin-dependent protein